MDYEAEDKGIFEKLTTEALKRVMAASNRNETTGHWSFDRASQADIRLAIDGADIEKRRCTGIMRPRFYAIQCALMQAYKEKS